LAYRIEIIESAQRALGESDRRTRLRVSRAIDKLAANPRPPGSTKLVGTAGRYRIRVGNYRILYEIQDAVLLVLVVKVGHRRDVYRPGGL